MAVVIADASPLIGLERAGHLGILPHVFTGLVAPPAVIAEFGSRPDWLHEIGVSRPGEVALLRALMFGRGEAEALAVALDLPGSTLLLDEKRARRFAVDRGVAVIGTAGVVLRAKQIGFIRAARPILDDLIATNFRLSENLYEATLRAADEH